MFVVPPFAGSVKMLVHRDLTLPDHANRQAYPHQASLDHANRQAYPHQASLDHANPQAYPHQASLDHGTCLDARQCSGAVSRVVRPCAQPSMGRKQHGPPEGGPC